MDDNELLRYCLCAARNHVGNVGERNDALLFDLLQAIHEWPEFNRAKTVKALNALVDFDRRKLNESSESRHE